MFQDSQRLSETKMTAPHERWAGWGGAQHIYLRLLVGECSTHTESHALAICEVPQDSRTRASTVNTISQGQCHSARRFNYTLSHLTAWTVEKQEGQELLRPEPSLPASGMDILMMWQDSLGLGGYILTCLSRD